MENLSIVIFLPESETAYTWATSTFTDAQWADYGKSLNILHYNPFTKDQTVDRSHTIADHVRSIIRDYKSKQDALARVEGAFSPVQLDNLAHKLELENNADIKNAIITFSHEFANRFAEPHNFDALSTPVLKRIYDATTDKSIFLKEVLETIIDDSVAELAKDGTLNIHIAPFAYNKDAEVFHKQLTDAYKLLDPLKQQRIKSVLFTIREGQDTVNSIISLVPKFQTSDEPSFGFALGGDPKSPELITELFNAVGNSVDTVVHFGLEKEYPVMEKRLQTLLKTVKDAGRPDVLLSHLSIHIDDGYEHFNVYIKNHPEDKELLDTLIKSVSPLGYLLTRGREGFDNYQEFAKNFKDAIPGSNNACMMAGIGIAAQNWATKLFSE